MGERRGGRRLGCYDWVCELVGCKCLVVKAKVVAVREAAVPMDKTEVLEGHGTIKGSMEDAAVLRSVVDAIRRVRETGVEAEHVVGASVHALSRGVLFDVVVRSTSCAFADVKG